MLNKTALFLLSVTLLFCSCSNNVPGKNGKAKHTITIAGSTSVMPFTEKLAEHFMVDHSEFVINVQGGGSTAGIQAIMNNTVNIGMSSRELNDKEKMLNTITICHDGIAIIVHPQNSIKSLTLLQIRDIFNGRIKNWRELGGTDRRIDAVTREEGSGTRSAFEELVMKGKAIDDSIMVQDSNGSVKEVVATDPYAMGYISLGLVDQKVQSVTIDGVSPSIKTIKNGRYKIVRPFLYVTNGELDTHAKEFVDFILSRDGQKILVKEGLVSLYD